MKIAPTAVQRLQAALGDDHPYTLAAQDGPWQSCWLTRVSWTGPSR